MLTQTELNLIVASFHKGRKKKFGMRTTGRISILNIVNLVVHNNWSHAQTARYLKCSRQYVNRIMKLYREYHNESG